jgi:hypothetical protein
MVFFGAGGGAGFGAPPVRTLSSDSVTVTASPLRNSFFFASMWAWE